MCFKGIYRDNGIVIFKGNLKANDVGHWLRNFQEEVNALVGLDYLKFTAKVWGKDKLDGNVQNDVMVREEDSFSYLDMEIFWSNEDELSFRVHLKENQQLKYLTRGSMHTKACFQAIPSGVFRHLDILTTEMEESNSKKLDELYPLHAEALKVAKLVPEVFPTLGKVLADITTKPNKKDKKEKQQDKRTVYFCLGVSKHWSTPIHTRLRELCNKHGLRWLRVSMSYHRFSNLRDIFQGNLNQKLMEGILSHNFMDLPCNCNKTMKLHGQCVYNGDCRKMCVIYKVTCRICDNFYIGNTQQKMKNWQGQHLDDVKKLVMKEICSDSFAAHFAGHCTLGVKPSNKELREMMKYQIIWQGNPISCMKTFGKLDCLLCMRERIEILKAQFLEHADIRRGFTGSSKRNRA